MSTYTDLHTRIRENLTILRQPGNDDDGMTPQRVIFANPANVYYGTFKGSIDAVSASFSNAQLNDCKINGGIIDGAKIMLNGDPFDINELTTSISQMSTLAENASISASSALMSCEALQSICNEISVKFGNEISNVVAEQLPLLSGNLIDVVSGAISNDMSALSSGLVSYVDEAVIGISSIVSGDIQTLSNHVRTLENDEKYELRFRNLEIGNSDIHNNRTSGGIGSFLSTAIGGEVDYVRNNTEYLVQFKDVPLSAKIVLGDGTVLGNGDMVIVHQIGGTEDATISVKFSDMHTYNANSNPHGNVFIAKAGVSKYELEDEVAARLNADSTISGWISRNFANSGEHNDDNTTTFKNSLSAANGISVDGHSYASSLTASTLSVELSDFTCHVSNEICTLQDVIDNATAKLTPEQLSAISSISSKLEASDICANYISNVISLSVKGNQILNVDCNDFFNADGRLSTVELSNNDLIFRFSKEIIDPISISLSSIGKDYSEEISKISNDCSDLSNDLSVISNDLSSKLTSADISIKQTDQYIYIYAKGNKVGDISCAAFIKDGMLSSVELLSNTLVFAFNTEEATTPISVDLTSFINTDVYAGDITYLSGEISANAKALLAKADKSAMAITSVDNDTTKKSIQLRNDLSQIVVVDHQQLSSINSSNAYVLGNQNSKPLQAAGNYLSSNALNSYTTYDATVSSLSNDGYATSNSLTAYYTKSETSSANEVSIALAGKTKTQVSQSFNGTLTQTNLSVIKVTDADLTAYAQALDDGTLNANAVYVFDLSSVNAFGRKVVNAAPGEASTDVATYGQLTSTVDALSNAYQAKGDYLSSSISSSFAQLSDVSKVYIKNPENKAYQDGKQSDLSIVKLPTAEYANMLSANEICANTLYVVSSDYNDAYGMQIKNLAAGTEISDAATIGQLNLANAQIAICSASLNVVQRQVNSKISWDDARKSLGTAMMANDDIASFYSSESARDGRISEVSSYENALLAMISVFNEWSQLSS